jgi:hypothetical protein
MRNSANLFPQVSAIDGLNLRDIDHTRPWQVRVPFTQADVARECGIAKIGGNCQYHRCVEATEIKSIMLQDEGWSASPWF